MLHEEMQQQQATLTEQCRLMQEAMAAMTQQGKQLESLIAAVKNLAQPPCWEPFARAADIGNHTSAPSVAETANLSIPPVYRGCKKKEKPAFMDSYMVYERRVQAVNAGSGTNALVMHFGARIDHRTLMRICLYENEMEEAEFTEER